MVNQQLHWLRIQYFLWKNKISLYSRVSKKTQKKNNNNKLATTFIKNSNFHKTNKHIKIEFHCIHELVKDNKKVILKFCSSKNQIIDILIKVISISNVEELGLRNCGSP